MKVVRYGTAFLLLLSGIVHILHALTSIDGPQALPILVFGIFYFTIGILLTINFRFALMLGVIFPLIGLASGIFVIGFHNWTTILTILFIIDAIVVLSCILCIAKSRKQGRVS